VLRKRHTILVAGLLAIVILGGVSLAISDPGLELLFVLAVAPASYLLWHFHHADKYKKESTRLLAGTFALGAAFALPAGFIEVTLGPFIPGSDMLSIFLYFLFVVALVEELTKFISVRIYSYRSVHFDEAMDGIIFGVTGALGFATVENIGYVLGGGIVTAVERAFLSVPGHAFWGAIIGFYLGEAKVKHRPILALKGLAFTVSLHGLYDTLSIVLPGGITVLLVAGGLVWIVYFEVVKKEIAKAQSESLYGPHPTGAA
jgi:protease PrsW